MEFDNSNNQSPSRRSYTISFKFSVIAAYYNEFHENSEEKARFYKLNGSIVRRWLQNQNLLNAHSSKKQNGR